MGKEKSSAVGKLARAAALAALLVPLGSIATDAATISCSFSPESGGFCDDGPGGAEGFGTSATYPFNGGAFGGGYTVDLDFDDVRGKFDVSITNHEISQSDASWGAWLANFPGHICIPIADLALSKCVVFDVVGPDQGLSTWEGFYDIFISWAALTDGQYGDSPPGSNHVLHGVGAWPDIAFPPDSDITIPGSYTTCPPDCFEETLFVGDPGLGGTDNSFSPATVTNSSTVPEPSTMLLLTSGLGTALYRRFRRRNQP